MNIPKLYDFLFDKSIEMVSAHNSHFNGIKRVTIDSNSFHKVKIENGIATIGDFRLISLDGINFSKAYSVVDISPLGLDNEHLLAHMDISTTVEAIKNILNKMLIDSGDKIELVSDYSFILYNLNTILLSIDVPKTLDLLYIKNTSVKVNEICTTSSYVYSTELAKKNKILSIVDHKFYITDGYDNNGIWNFMHSDTKDKSIIILECDCMYDVVRCNVVNDAMNNKVIRIPLETYVNDTSIIVISDGFVIHDVDYYRYNIFRLNRGFNKSFVDVVVLAHDAKRVNINKYVDDLKITNMAEIDINELINLNVKHIYSTNNDADISNNIDLMISNITWSYSDFICVDKEKNGDIIFYQLPNEQLQSFPFVTDVTINGKLINLYEPHIQIRLPKHRMIQSILFVNGIALNPTVVNDVVDERYNLLYYPFSRLLKPTDCVYIMNIPHLSDDFFRTRLLTDLNATVDVNYIYEDSCDDFVIYESDIVNFKANIIPKSDYIIELNNGTLTIKFNDTNKYANRMDLFVGFNSSDVSISKYDTLFSSDGVNPAISLEDMITIYNSRLVYNNDDIIDFYTSGRFRTLSLLEDGQLAINSYIQKPTNLVRLKIVSDIESFDSYQTIKNEHHGHIPSEHFTISVIRHGKNPDDYEITDTTKAVIIREIDQTYGIINPLLEYVFNKETNKLSPDQYTYGNNRLTNTFHLCKNKDLHIYYKSSVFEPIIKFKDKHIPFINEFMTVFVNGRHIHQDDIVVISPYVIYIKNLRSLDNIKIFTTIPEYYNVDTKDKYSEQLFLLSIDELHGKFNLPIQSDFDEHKLNFTVDESMCQPLIEILASNIINSSTKPKVDWSNNIDYNKVNNWTNSSNINAIKLKNVNENKYSLPNVIVNCDDDGIIRIPLKDIYSDGSVYTDYVVSLRLICCNKRQGETESINIGSSLLYTPLYDNVHDNTILFKINTNKLDTFIRISGFDSITFSHYQILPTPENVDCVDFFNFVKLYCLAGISDEMNVVTYDNKPVLYVDTESSDIERLLHDFNDIVVDGRIILDATRSDGFNPKFLY